MSSPERAVHVLRALAAVGVQDVVLAPGSRSAPFALAAYAADAAGDLRLHVRLDERSAGFLALGLAVGSRRPVAVITTSGTAVGNLLPAVMEAYHGGHRIVVVSADRPAELRGTGANQTTWQAGIFGRFAPCCDLAPDRPARAVDEAVAAILTRPGPTQLNVQLPTPLVPEPGLPWWPMGPMGPGTPGWPDGGIPSGVSETVQATAFPPETASGVSETVQATAFPPETASGVSETVHATAFPREVGRGARTVVVAGDDAGSTARVFAQTYGLPLLAEPTSGARAGVNAIRSYRLLLGAPGAADGLAGRIERVVVAGHPTLSRPVTELLSRPDLQILAVRSPRSGTVTDPGRVAEHLDTLPTLHPAAPSEADREWLAQWQAADQAVSALLDRFVEQLPELHPLQVAAEVGAAVRPGQSLVVGSSHPVRDLDLMLAPYPPGQRRMVVGNRGLAGIDGTLSTAIGVDLGRAGAPRTLALVGDVTFLHDSNGLFIGPDEPSPDLTVVVVNDDGGSIFAVLEQGGPPYAAAFERVFATPHHADLAALCAASHTAYRLVNTRAQLRAALADPGPGLRVVEARVGRADRRATAAALGQLPHQLAEAGTAGPPGAGGRP